MYTAPRPNELAGNWVVSLSFPNKYQTLSQKYCKSWQKVWFWLANLCFFPMKFNNLSDIAHNWVFWGFEGLSFLLEFWALSSLSFLKNVQFLSLTLTEDFWNLANRPLELLLEWSWPAFLLCERLYKQLLKIRKVYNFYWIIFLQCLKPLLLSSNQQPW